MSVLASSSVPTPSRSLSTRIAKEPRLAHEPRLGTQAMSRARLSTAFRRVAICVLIGLAAGDGRPACSQEPPVGRAAAERVGPTTEKTLRDSADLTAAAAAIAKGRVLKEIKWGPVLELVQRADLREAKTDPVWKQFEEEPARRRGAAHAFRGYVHKVESFTAEAISAQDSAQGSARGKDAPPRPPHEDRHVGPPAHGQTPREGAAQPPTDDNHKPNNPSAVHLLTLMPLDATEPVLLAVPEIPAAWVGRSDTLGHEPQLVSVRAAFVAVRPEEKKPRQVWAAAGVAWLPDAESPALGVDIDQVLLGKLDFDATRLSQVRDLRPLNARENRLLGDLLAALDKTRTDKLLEQMRLRYDLNSLWEAPERQRGRLLAIVGRVTTVRRVDLLAAGPGDPDHYYELSIKPLVAGQDPADPDGGGPVEAPVPTPLKTAVRRLPYGMTELALRDRLVRLPAFYFKLWKYLVVDPQSPFERKTAVSPLLVGLEPQIVRLKPKRKTTQWSTPPQSARDYLERLLIDESRLRSLIDGRRLGPDEDEILLDILHRVDQITEQRQWKWQRFDVPWRALAETPQRHRAHFFHLSGTVTGVELVRIPEDLARHQSFNAYYRLTFELADSPLPVVVLSRSVPDAWRQLIRKGDGRGLRTRAELYGLFLKVGEQTDEGPQLVFAARRIGWRPESASKELGVSDDQVYLARLGMDVGLFDRVRNATEIETESFYRLMAAVSNASHDEFAKRARRERSLAPILTPPPPKRPYGQLFSFQGIARKVTRIDVESEDVRTRLGIEYYYQIVLFVPERVEARAPVEGAEPIIYERYPVVFCVRELPPGLPVGDDVDQLVRIDGVLYSTWEYRSEFMNRKTRELLSQKQDGTRPPEPFVQHSPLLIGQRPEVIQVEYGQTNTTAGLIIGGLFALALIGVWYGVWRWTRSDKEFQKTALARQFQLADEETLQRIGEQAQDQPDFSGLEQDGNK